ncbi:hypothetical protein NFHSH190041_11640 [Shewanella sp. NFH-SH190041]|uniref:GGDEF domain-containing protein n=1 Tax=Shewanella sp. NFH-SH190041 TaxID=2950245 RepID=UPI0021C3C371|nr:GGDEF domain-containing protein [Shewanella sp. NFH-SH190041]BDM63712.1 hypothetical protein NFHSH190041_11640 [Shewanella sp. NFH-SH190041]
MRRYLWQTSIILLSIADLLVLLSSTRLLEYLNYAELWVELVRLPVWLFLMIYVEQLRKYPTIYPWLLSGTTCLYLGTVFNINDEFFNLEHPIYQLSEDLLLTAGTLACGLGLYRLLKQLTEQTELLSDLALGAPLAGLANRRNFYQQRQQHPHSDRVSLLLIGVDDYAELLASQGLPCGDYQLVKLAELIGSVIRKHDRVIRWGGDEFALELGGADLNTARVKAEHLRLLIADHYFHFAGKHLRLTVSIGIAQYASQAGGRQQAVSEATRALKQAKAQGGNQVCLAQDVQTQESAAMQSIAGGIK